MGKRYVLLALLICFFTGAVFAGARVKETLPVPVTGISSDTLQKPPTGFGRRMFLLDSAGAALRIVSLSDSLILNRLPEEVPGLSRQISIIAVGDIMPGTNYPKASYLPPDAAALFRDVAPLIRSADIATGNLEGVIDGGQGMPKTCHDLDNCYVFRMPATYVNTILDAGFDIVGTANNHVNDFGAPGRAGSARALQQSPSFCRFL